MGCAISPEVEQPRRALTERTNDIGYCESCNGKLTDVRCFETTHQLRDGLACAVPAIADASE